MTAQTIADSTSAVQPQQERDPKFASEALRLYIEHHPGTTYTELYNDLLEQKRTFIGPPDDFQRALLEAARLMAGDERWQQAQQQPNPDWYSNWRATAREAQREFSVGRAIVCRQCHKTDCGHLRRH